MPLLENTNSFILNSFNGAAVKNGAYGLKTNKQTNKKPPTSPPNKQTKPKQQNQQKTERGDAHVPSCSSACSESCSVQLGAVLGCVTCTASPRGFTQGSLKSFRYRQHAPNPEVFFFFFPRQTSCFLARR